jgi:uroporphyrinogen III methyltransferase/synthase
VDSPQPEIAEQMAAGKIGWTTVTSSAIAVARAVFGDSLRKTKLVSISPITSATLRESGYEPAAEAAVRWRGCRGDPECRSRTEGK